MEREGMKPCGRESPFSTSRPSCYWSRLCLECPPAQPLLESALTWEGSLPPVWSRARYVSQRILHPSLSSGSGCRGPAWQTAPLPEEEGQGQVHETVSSTSALGGLWLGFSSGPLSHVRCSTGRQAPGGLRSCLEGCRLRTTKNTGRSGSSGSYGLPCWLRWQRICLQCRKSRFYPWVRKIPWRRRWQPTPIFLPGESHGQRGLASYSPWGCKKWGTNERLTLTDGENKSSENRTWGELQLHWVMILSSKFHPSSKINGNHLQYSKFVWERKRIFELMWTFLWPESPDCGKLIMKWCQIF